MGICRTKQAKERGFYALLLVGWVACVPFLIFFIHGLSFCICGENEEGSQRRIGSKLFWQIAVNNFC